MTSYGDPHAGPEYDDGYHHSPNAGRAQVPHNQDAYNYDQGDPGQGGYPDQGGYPAPGGYPDQAGYPPQSGYPDQAGYYEQQGGGYPPPQQPGYGYPDQGYSEYDGPDYQVDQGYYAPAAGRASVPTASGRASVPMGGGGRAAVLAPPPAGRAPVRPAGPGDYDDDLDGPATKPKKSKSKKRKRAWQKWVVSGVALTILLAGGGLIAGTYFFSTVKEPSELTLDLSTEVWSADGKQIAKMGKKNRIPVVVDKSDGEGKVPKMVQYALIAGEDTNFFEHNGIDLWGIGRAAWNNLTGGETQGASTITQQYARHAAQDMEVTYARKLREAVMARKLEDQYEKHQILGFYLNTVYFGRGADGVGAAAKAYFGSGASAEKLTIEQAALLGAVLKQPEPDDSSKGFDPHYDPAASKDRWAYVLKQMVDKGWLSQVDRDKMKYPEELLVKYDPAANTGEWGYTDSGTGHVINYVRQELEDQGYIQQLKKDGFKSWRDSGIKVTVSIDRRVQDALEKYIMRGQEGSLVNAMPENIMAAGVIIDPTNGRVVGYYGGTNGTGPDFAGTYTEGGVLKGGHPPASSFKIYTLTAALSNGYSIKSPMDPTPLKSAKNGGTDPIDLSNANREGELSCLTYCTLEEMTIKSYNVPFFHIAQDIGPAKVIDMAQKAGVGHMWNVDGTVYDLNADPNAKNKFDPYVGFGKYPITVLDHASGASTLAAHGTYFKPHFVLKVERKNSRTGKLDIVPNVGEVVKGEPRIRREVADEVTSVLKQISKGHALDNGKRDTAGKTGTWENGNDKNENAHAWFVGYTEQLAGAIWVGNKNEELPLRTKPPITKNGKLVQQGDKIGGSALPGEIFEQVMNLAVKNMAIKATKLPDSKGIGDKSKGDGKSPTPEAPPCLFPMLCPTGGGPGGGGGGFPRPTHTATKPPR